MPADEHCALNAIMARSNSGTKIVLLKIAHAREKVVEILECYGDGLKYFEYFESQVAMLARRRYGPKVTRPLPQWSP